MIYVVTHYYPPVSNPPAIRMDTLVSLLIRKYGAENVTVVTGRPNHPEGILPKEYRWRLCRESSGKHGEKIVHLYELAAPNRGFFRKTLGYVSFATAVFICFLFRKVRKCDLIIATVPPVFTGYAIHLASCVKKQLRYIIDVRDLWPQCLPGLGFLREGSFLYNFFAKWSDRMYNKAIYRVGNSPGFCKHFASINLAENNSFIPNPIDLKSIQQSDSKDQKDFRAANPAWFNADITMLYAGTQGAYRGLDVLIKAVELLKPDPGALRILMIGYGEAQAELKTYIREHGLTDYFVFIPHMPRSQLIQVVSCSDYCFSSATGDPNIKMCIPTKVLEYLACEKHVIGSHNNTFIEDLAQMGLVSNVPSGDFKALAGLIKSGMANPVTDTGRQARQYVADNFSQEVFYNRWFRVLEQVSGNYETCIKKNHDIN